MDTSEFLDIGWTNVGNKCVCDLFYRQRSSNQHRDRSMDKKFPPKLWDIFILGSGLKPFKIDVFEYLPYTEKYCNHLLTLMPFSDKAL